MEFKNHPNGFFAVFEGIDGCGKSSQLNRAQLWYKAHLEKELGRQIVTTKEPDKDNYWGKKIYEDLVNPSGVHKTDRFEFQRWYGLNCAEIMSKNCTHLSEGKIIFQDRTHLVSCVYGSNNFSEVLEYNRIARNMLRKDFIWPDVIFIFDLDTEIALERLRKKGRVLDGFEERKEFLAHVRNLYQLYFREYPNCVIIGAARAEEEIFVKVREELCTRLFKKIGDLNLEKGGK